MTLPARHHVGEGVKMNKILELQGMGNAPAQSDAGPASSPYSTLSWGVICVTSTISLSLCTP